MPAVRAWVEGRVSQLQGFSDQIVIDAVMRRLEPQLGAAERSGAPWQDAGGGLAKHLGLLLDDRAV
eukprot:22567-Prymnesium_polylepis.1